LSLKLVPDRHCAGHVELHLREVRAGLCEPPVPLTPRVERLHVIDGRRHVPLTRNPTSHRIVNYTGDSDLLFRVTLRILDREALPGVNLRATGDPSGAPFFFDFFSFLPGGTPLNHL